jgi:hypothetical protein
MGSDESVVPNTPKCPDMDPPPGGGPYGHPGLREARRDPGGHQRTPDPLTAPGGVDQNAAEPPDTLRLQRRLPCPTRTPSITVQADHSRRAASRATMAAADLRYVRTFHLDWEDPLPGSELGEVEYAISREQWLAS